MLELDQVQKVDGKGSASLMISAMDARTVQTTMFSNTASFLSVDRPMLDLRTLRVGVEGEAGTPLQRLRSLWPGRQATYGDECHSKRKVCSGCVIPASPVGGLPPFGLGLFGPLSVGIPRGADTLKLGTGALGVLARSAKVLALSANCCGGQCRFTVKAGEIARALRRPSV